MKKVIVIIAILILPLAGFAQSNANIATTTINTEVIIKKIEEVKPKKASSSAIKAKLIRLNHKKSNDIISIKAFQKKFACKNENSKTLLRSLY